MSSAGRYCVFGSVIPAQARSGPSSLQCEAVAFLDEDVNERMNGCFADVEVRTDRRTASPGSFGAYGDARREWCKPAAHAYR
jgi:hypothetical protein